MTKEQILTTTEYIASLLLSIQNGTEPQPLPDGVTLADVYKTASRHSLAAAAYLALSSTIAEADIPDAARAKWAREADLAAVQQVRHTAAFAEITAAFTRAEIPFLPIKGFIIKALWTRPELRTMADMDIVVPREDFDRAGETLTSLGYTLDHDGEVHYSYTKNTFVNVELHRMLYGDATESFSDWTPRENNPYWYEMSYEDLVTFLLRHAYKHYEGGGCGLRTVFDFYLLFEKQGRPEDNPVLTDKLRAAGLYDFCRIMLALSDRWFCGKVDSSYDDAALYIATGGVYGTLDNNVSYSIEKRGGRVRHVIYRLFPPAKNVRGRYKWANKYPILLPLAYIVRIFTSLFDGKARREMQSVGKNRS